MRKYYTQINNGQKGPLDIEELKSLQINSDTPIWYDGLTEWTTAGKVEELKPVLFVTPPPFVQKEKITEPKKVTAKAQTQKSNFGRNLGRFILFVGICTIIGLIANYSQKENGSGINIEYRAADPQVINSRADRLKSGLLKLRVTVYGTIENRGSAGDVIVTFHVLQDGNDFTQSRELYMQAGEIQEVETTFDEVRRMDGDIEYHVDVRAD